MRVSVEFNTLSWYMLEGMEPLRALFATDLPHYIDNQNKPLAIFMFMFQKKTEVTNSSISETVKAHYIDQTHLQLLKPWKA